MSLNLRSYTLPQLKQLKARIEKEIAKQASASKASVLKKLTKLAREHGLSLGDVLGSDTPAKRQKPASTKTAALPKAPLPVKYRHPAKQDLAWSGRGRKPQWVEAWLANGGAIDALATAAAKFEKRQQRSAAKASPDTAQTNTLAASDASATAPAPAIAE